MALVAGDGIRTAVLHTESDFVHSEICLEEHSAVAIHWSERNEAMQHAVLCAEVHVIERILDAPELQQEQKHDHGDDVNVIHSTWPGMERRMVMQQRMDAEDVEEDKRNGQIQVLHD